MIQKYIRNPLKNLKSLRLNIPHITSRRLANITDDNLYNKKYIRKLIRSKHNGTTYKAQRGLYHNQKVTTKKEKCFSDKKKTRRVDMNVFKKKYRSEILDKEIKLNVTSKVFRTIDKMGGFDNYILLTKPEKMDSLFGEFLRMIMLKKINDPGLDIKNMEVFGTTPDVFKSSRKRDVFSVPYYTPEYRHKDKTKDRMRLLDDLTKRELKLFKEIYHNPDQTDQIIKNHPLVEENKKIIENERNEPELIKIKNQVRDLMMNQKNKKMYKYYKMDILQEAKLYNSTVNDLDSYLEKESENPNGILGSGKGVFGDIEVFEDGSKGN